MAARHRKRAHGGTATGSDNKNTAQKPVPHLYVPNRSPGTKISQNADRFGTDPMSVEGSSAIPRLGRKRGGKLTYQERKHLKTSSFVFPGERRYPLPDESHGRNALARVSQFGSASEKAKVRAAVHKKFPSIGK